VPDRDLSGQKADPDGHPEALVTKPVTRVYTPLTHQTEICCILIGCLFGHVPPLSSGARSTSRLYHTGSPESGRMLSRLRGLLRWSRRLSAPVVGGTSVGVVRRLRGQDRAVLAWKEPRFSLINARTSKSA